MHPPSYYAFLAVSLSATFGLALPSPAAPVHLAKRVDWLNNATGNVHMFFSDDTVKLGTLSVDKLMDAVSDQCNTEGTCDPDSHDITGYSLATKGLPDGLSDETVTVSVTGTYPTWIHNGLLDSLRAAVKAVAKCDNTTIQLVSSGYESATVGPPQTYLQCTVPRFWGINYQPPSANADNSPPAITNDLKVTYPDDSGFCSTFTSVGAAVAGAISGPAGSVFSLIGLICQK